MDGVDEWLIFVILVAVVVSGALMVFSLKLLILVALVKGLWLLFSAPWRPWDED